MATGDSGNYAGGLIEVIAADAIVAMNKANVCLDLVTVESRDTADQITFSVWNAGTNTLTSADVGTHSESDSADISATALDSEKKTLTLDMYSVRVPIHDEARLSNADDPDGKIAAVMGNALAAKIDAMINANYDNFSTGVGDGSAAFTVDNLFEALKSLKNAGAPGPYSGVFYGSQIWGTYGILNDLVTSAQFGGSPSAQEEGLSTGYVQTIAGVGIYDSPEFTEASSAVKGGIFSKAALGFGYAGAFPKVERERMAVRLKDDYVGSFFGATGELIDSYGVEVHTKTS